MNYFKNLPIDILRNIYSMDNTYKTIFTNEIIKSYNILDAYNESFIENLNDEKIKCIYNFLFRHCDLFGDLENNNKFRHDLYSINFKRSDEIINFYEPYQRIDYYNIYKHISPNSIEKEIIISVGLRSCLINYKHMFSYHGRDRNFYISVYSGSLHFQTPNKYQLHKFKECTYRVKK